MGAFHKVIGIDLGTTYSVVAAYNMDRSDVRVIPNRQGEPTTPSVVYISAQGQVSVGRAAKEKLARDPGGVIIEAKRLMGEQKEGSNGKAMVRASGRELDPEFVSAHILKELKACAEKMIGEPVHDAVITVPAYFREPQKNATREAAKIARLNPRLIINEPTAAAIAYGLESGEQQTFIVYDLGGGTFDVSIVRVVDERNVEVLGTGGDAHLGGGDIDQEIVSWALGKIRQQHGQDITDPKILGRLRLEAERVKINLCNENAPQEFALTNLTPAIEEISYVLPPDEFNRMIQPLLERTVEQVNVALASAQKNHDATLEDIEAFILVGGSSKIPAVTQLLKDRFRKPIKSDLNPDEIVAMGAARVALNYPPSLAAEIRDDVDLKIDNKAKAPEGVESTGWKDVVSHTLGIGLIEDRYDPLIPKDHVIPHKVVRGGYTTARDNQSSIFVPVYQGDNPKASQNHQIGKVVIDNLTPEPKGTHRFEITFALNADGIFEGEVHHLQTGKVHKIELDRGQGQITEKKRLELSETLASGVVPTAEADPIDKLVLQATEAMTALPPERQREIGELLVKLMQARAGKDAQAQGVAVAALTMALMRSRS